MRKNVQRIRLTAAVLLAAVTAAGAGAAEKVKAQELDYSWENEIWEDDAWTEAYDIYADVISEHVAAINENWDVGQYLDADFSECFSGGGLFDNGFYMEDIDSDGTPELFLGGIVDPGYEASAMFYEMYTIENQEAVQVTVCGYRSATYLLDDGVIKETGALSAAASSEAYYNMTDGGLELVEALLFDGGYDAENPWFYSTEDMWEDHSESISEEEALNIQAGYREMISPIPYVSFGEYYGYVDSNPSSQTESWDSAAYPVGTIIHCSASSELNEVSMNTVHRASNVLDNDLTTGWTEDAPGQGYDESILFMFDESYEISGIIVYAGFQKTEDLYYKNSRPLTMTARFDDGSAQTINFEDVFGKQMIYFDYPVETSSVELTIDSVYPGWKYEDTVISELRFF